MNECTAVADNANTLHSPFWAKAAARFQEIEVPQRPVAGWSYASFVHVAGPAAEQRKYVDQFEYLWSPDVTRPKQFDDKILPHTLYILAPALKDRAERAMNKTTDLLATIDGVLVLAPGWKSPRENAGRAGEPVK